MKSRCLCQICTCGRHHCPRGSTRIYEDAGVSCPTTEYLEKYPTYGCILPPQSLKPKQEFRACRGKMEGITTFKSDYRPYEIVKQPRHAPEEYKPKQGEIDLGTTYKRDYNSYKVQPVALVRPLERQRVKQGKLDTVPTYKEWAGTVPSVLESLRRSRKEQHLRHLSSEPADEAEELADGEPDMPFTGIKASVESTA